MLALQAKEEVEALEKKMVQLENELTTTTTNLENSNKRLEEREKALQNVSHTPGQCHCFCMSCLLTSRQLYNNFALDIHLVFCLGTLCILSRTGSTEMLT